MPYMWDGFPHSYPDVWPAAIIVTSSPCGKNRKKSSTVYPQDKAVFAPIHILENLQLHSHIWGYKFKEISDLKGISPQGEALIHR